MEPRRVALVALVIVLASVLPFVASPRPSAATGAVAFGETKSTGLPDRVVFEARESSLAIPKAQATYAQYRYVVGYHGVTSLVAATRTTEERELGRPLSVYVTDFTGTDVRVGPDGYLRADERDQKWVAAPEAFFVVNSSARLPTRKTAIVPFADRAAATEFAEQYGGRVVRWEAALRQPVGRVGRTVEGWRDVVARRHARANRTVDAARDLLARPVSVTVGEDVETLAAAVRQAPPNTTIRLPPGTYRTDGLRLEKPLTVRGAGRNATRLVGDGNGSVVTGTAPRTAVADLSITGVGTTRSGRNATNANVSVPEDDWRYTYYKVHGYGDAAVVFDDAGHSLVSNVRVNTTSNGVLARTSPGVVVANLTLYGTERWQDGFLGVSAVGAPVVVQDSRFYGGKVGVYVYDASGAVVRDSRMEGMMVGVFDLFGPRILVANTTVEDVWTGIYLETRSYGNTVVRNRLHNDLNGLIVAGQSNFVARNTLVHNDLGLQVHGQFARYTHNTLAYNRVGAESGALLPLNRVGANDFVGNGRYVSTQAWNVLHVWRGNYWTGAPGANWDGSRHLDRPFRPTGPVDRRVTTTGAPTLARSPALGTLRRLQRVVPGLQGAGVLDPRPLAQPARSDHVEGLRTLNDTVGTHPDGDRWGYRP